MRASTRHSRGHAIAGQGLGSEHGLSTKVVMASLARPCQRHGLWLPAGVRVCTRESLESQGPGGEPVTAGLRGHAWGKASAPAHEATRDKGKPRGRATLGSLAASGNTGSREGRRGRKVVLTGRSCGQRARRGGKARQGRSRPCRAVWHGGVEVLVLAW